MLLDARIATALAVLVHALLSEAQATWQEGQVNTSMCYWEQLRAGVVRDTVYLDGGYLWWLPGLSDGQFAAIISDYNPLGKVYTLNFSVPFDTNQNITAILGTLSKTPNGDAANNLAPNYYDGALLANDDEWFLYGGLLRDTAAFTPPYAGEVTAYEAYQYGVQKDGFSVGFLDDRLPSGMTRYIAYGGAGAAPSENKAWYFSGMHSPSWGEIYTPTLNESETAVNVSNTFITLDMSVQQQETWKNVSLPPGIDGRANPELVWVPVGPQGILVALGGVVYPEFVSSAHVSSNVAASERDSPVFMSTMDIYDVAGDAWYKQPTAGGGPGALTRGCAVVAPAQDYSSFNIYWYGGYDGLHVTQDFNDDVWVLSLPSFTWTMVAPGSAGHGRAGHKCVMPYPDQMMVIGGSAALIGSAPTCLEDGIIRIFNLTSSTWLTSYDPAKWGNYSVPETIREKIGGSETGGATLTTPSPSGWATANLSSVFATAYPTTKITTYYPYASASAENNTNPELNPTNSGSHSGTPSYLAPVLGSILGVMFVALLGLGFLLWRKRKLLKLRGTSETGTEDTKGYRIISWMRGQQPNEAKPPPTLTSDETMPMSPDGEIPHAGYLTLPPMSHHEMEDNHIAELMDTSPRPELQDTGLTPVEIINKHTHFGTSANASAYGSISATDHASELSGLTSGGSPPSAEMRPDSPPLGTPALGAPSPSSPDAGPARQAAVVSGVSEISERDRAHLRQMSDATVCSAATAAAAAAAASGGGSGGDGPAAGRDRAGSTTQERRSIFRENEEDLGGNS